MRKITLLVLIISCIVAILVSYILFKNNETNVAYSNEILNNVLLQRALLVATTSDFIYGNIDAPKKIVIYSDIDCRYCRAVLPKLMTLVNNATSDVVLVYRPYPLFDQQSAVGDEELILMCVQKLKGNTAVFNFLKYLTENLQDSVTFTKTPKDILYDAVVYVSIPNSDLEICLDKNKVEFSAQIEEIRNNGRALNTRSLPQVFMFSDIAYYSFVGDRSIDFYERVLTEM